MITAPENGNELITSLVLIDRGTVRPTLSALKTVLDGGDITLYHDVESDMLDTEPTATSIAWDLTVQGPDPNAQNLVFKELDCEIYLGIEDPRDSEETMRWSQPWSRPLKELRRQLKAEIHEEVMLLWQ
jgi:hypothetical protein